jgi:hypothetical protein
LIEVIVVQALIAVASRGTLQAAIRTGLAVLWLQGNIVNIEALIALGASGNALAVQTVDDAYLADSSILIKPIFADIASTVITASLAVAGAVDAKFAALVEEVLVHAGGAGCFVGASMAAHDGWLAERTGSSAGRVGAWFAGRALHLACSLGASCAVTDDLLALHALVGDLPVAIHAETGIGNWIRLEVAVCIAEQTDLRVKTDPASDDRAGCSWDGACWLMVNGADEEGEKEQEGEGETVLLARHAMLISEQYYI